VPYTDKTLACQDCGQSFTFSADDQEFFSTKGYSEPKRCPSCRQNRRSSNYGGSSSYGSGYGSQREMHDAVCAQCGKNTQVPFRPSGDRPVYCSDCFSKQPASSRRY